MKKVVWANKSNGQLCVTIPKNSGIKEGDVVSIEKQKIKKIVFSVVTGDLFHYGHLKLLENANEQGDFHVCGVLTNEAIKEYKELPKADLKERKGIISSLRCVDMVVTQNNLNPQENIETLRREFPDAQFIIVFGSNWSNIPGKEYFKEIGATVHQPEYYKKLPVGNFLEKEE